MPDSDVIVPVGALLKIRVSCEPTMPLGDIDFLMDKKNWSRIWVKLVSVRTGQSVVTRARVYEYSDGEKIGFVIDAPNEISGVYDVYILGRRAIAVGRMELPSENHLLKCVMEVDESE